MQSLCSRALSGASFQCRVTISVRTKKTQYEQPVIRITLLSEPCITFFAPLRTTFALDSCTRLCHDYIGAAPEAGVV